MTAGTDTVLSNSAWIYNKCSSLGNEIKYNHNKTLHNMNYINLARNHVRPCLCVFYVRILLLAAHINQIHNASWHPFRRAVLSALSTQTIHSRQEWHVTQ